MTLYDQIIKTLKDQNIAYQETRHQAVFTSQEAAAIRGNNLSECAKALIFETNENPIQIIIQGNKKVDKEKFKQLFGYTKLKMASAEDVEKISSVKPGAVPPFGNLFSFPIKVYCTNDLLKNDELQFNAGDHTISIRMKANKWQKIVNPITGDFAQSEQEIIKLLGIDYGTKKIGLALGTLSNSANQVGPLKIVKNDANPNIEKLALDEIATIIETESISKIIIGIPYMNGSEASVGKQIRQFGNRLKKQIKSHRQVIYVDESYTSDDSKAELLTHGIAKQNRSFDDSLAAAQILNRYLETNLKNVLGLTRELL